ncbi:unnamed protein product [Callosobruchus maculatus]|uniref:Uncharacterized protein n=1 Tax=Callosobruchus maculatus TaxID=64391 RepID=A0A653DGM6_CALMS|nr:unnamed protein product [Callosobruchus maculatus]
MTYAYRRLGSDGMDVVDDSWRVRLPSLLWIPVFIFGALLYFVDIFEIEFLSLQPTIESIKDFTYDSNKGFAINTPGCRIPEMDPFDPAVQPFILPPTRVKCNKGVPALFEANLTSIYILKSSLPAYNVSDFSDLHCCYSVIRRVEPKKKLPDNFFSNNEKCSYINGSTIIINDEFIKVQCFVDNTTIYTDTFSFVPIKNTTKSKVIYRKPLNVLVVGLDAVSRLNLHRQMPITVKYLQKLGAVEMLGYNKVGDNTFPNLIPVLTGLFEEELNKTCWPTQSSYFDNCTFIWHHFKSKGFMTVYGEDASWMGLFNYMRRGFKKQTTDYAYNYFNRYSENLIGNEHKMNVDQCEGARLVYKDLLEYIKKFVVRMNNSSLPFFGFFWGASLSHDYLNQPRLGDPDYQKFFQELEEGGHLNNTALVFMSDHGIRWGDIRQTYQGRMEERLPFVFVRLPKWYTNQFYKAYSNLKRNTRRLTTPFDLHETLYDLLDPYNLTGEYLKTTNKSRGISFFREITKYRTCEDAAIASHWCACQQSKELDTNSSEVFEVASFAVEFINMELQGYAQCANLTLMEILNARLMSHSGSDIEGVSNIKDYMITIKTVPGEAIFEVTVRYSEDERKYSVIGSISRLNLYGKQSACITDFHLKLYCYCKSLLS